MVWCSSAGLKTLGPAIQYLAGELPVEQGAVIPLLASHNTVHLRFDLEDADYLHLAKPDAAFPLQHFALATDAVKHQVPCQLRKVSIFAALRSVNTDCPSQNL